MGIRNYKLKIFLKNAAVESSMYCFRQKIGSAIFDMSNKNFQAIDDTLLLKKRYAIKS